MSFAVATLETLLQTMIPVADQFTGGKISDALDEIGDRAEAARIVAVESAELFEAVRDAARNGVPVGTINNVVAQAKDVAEAKKLLLDPSLVVDLDGVATTADDDVDPAGGA